jgi:two-component system, NarL family, sensor kinase
MPLQSSVRGSAGRAISRRLGLRRLTRVRRTAPRTLGCTELTRIALHLHDDVGQWLALAMLQLDTLAARMDATDALAPLRHTLNQAAAALRDTTRCLDARAHAPSLLEAMEQALANGPWADQPLTVRLAPQLAQLTATQAPVAVRALRELIANAHRHAHATRIEVLAWHQAGALCLRVNDNGQGLPTPAPEPHYGLNSLHQQIVAEGGTLHVRSAAGRGTRIAIDLPLRPVGAHGRTP